MIYLTYIFPPGTGYASVKLNAEKPQIGWRILYYGIKYNVTDILYHVEENQLYVTLEYSF